MLFYASLLFVSSVFVIVLMMFASVVSDSVADNITERRFTLCAQKNCRSSEGLAVVIPFREHELTRVAQLMEQLASKTTVSNYSKGIDVIFLHVNPSTEETEKLSRLDGLVAQLGTVFRLVFISKLEEYCPNDSVVLSTLFRMDAPEFLRKYCFIYFSSLDMHILRKSWVKDLVVQSTMSPDREFWIKSPLDMSLHPFAYYEQIEISLYSIYAAQSQCLQELFLLADEVYPSVSISKAFNSFLRDPGQLVLSHGIAPKIHISTFAVDMRETEISLEKVKMLFPDAAIAQGSHIH